MTVDVSSGRAVLLAQGIVVPRITAFGDCAGNYQSLGRFLVFNSRMVLYLTLYIVSECFESSELPECWHNVKQIISTEALPAHYQRYREDQGLQLLSLRHFTFAPEECGGDFLLMQISNMRALMRAGHRI